MRKILIFYILFFICHGICLSQNDSTHLYASLEEALLHPDKVQRISLKKQKLKEFPPQLFRLTNLKDLDLSSNKIREIPKEISLLAHLEVFNASNNYINQLPQEMGDLIYLRRLDLSRNDLEILPSSIGALLHLQELILWSTYVTEFPEEMKNLQNTLLYVDMRAIQMNPKKQKALRNLLPHTRIQMDRACNCN